MEGFFEWMLESSLLVVMVLGIRRFFMGKIRYAAIYSLWLIVLLRFLIPVDFIPAPINIGDAILSRITSDSGEHSGGAVKFLLRAGGMDGVEKNASGGSSSDAPSEGGNYNAIGTISSNSRRTSVWNCILFCSGIISAVLFVWIIASNVCMLMRMKRCRKFYGRRKGVNIYTVRSIDTPCLYGFLRPAIYIPQVFAADEKTGSPDRCVRVEDAELEQMITHEYVHYLHKDHIWALFRTILLSVYWFHPFLWAAVICSKKDAELFCDETVLSEIGEANRISYGEMLVRLAGTARWSDFRYSFSPMSRRGREMEQRIRAISSRKHYSCRLLVPLVLLASLALGVTCGTGALNIKGGAGGGTVKTPEISMNNDNDSANAGGGNIVNAKAMGAAGETAFDTGGFSNDYKQAFSHYINVFTEAVNTGNTEQLSYVLSPGSPVYEQQCSIAENYYERGIREEVKSYAIASVEKVNDRRVAIISKEKIKCTYADNTSKVVKQHYKYTCENIDGGWMITEMSDEEGVF